jgi:hypothetical protein
LVRLLGKIPTIHKHLGGKTTHAYRMLLLNGMTGSLARNMDSSGLASSSSESARDSATAYQACRQDSSGGQAVGWARQAEMAASKWWSSDWSRPSRRMLKLYMIVSAMSVR